MCIRLSSFVRLLCCAAVTYFDDSEESIVSIYRVTELVCVDAEMIRRNKNCLACGKVSGDMAKLGYGGREERKGLCLCQAHSENKVL
jgi:hypothetical protein